jgi:Nitrile hydratase, alpha chain
MQETQMTPNQSIGEDLPGGHDVRKSAESHLIAKAAKDEKFKTELIQNPKAVIAQELGLALPKDFEVKILQETPKSFYLVLPATAIGVDGELSDQLLEAVAGGGKTAPVMAGSQSGDTKHKQALSSTSGTVSQDGT